MSKPTITTGKRKLDGPDGPADPDAQAAGYTDVDEETQAEVRRGLQYYPEWFRPLRNEREFALAVSEAFRNPPVQHPMWKDIRRVLIGETCINTLVFVQEQCLADYDWTSFVEGHDPKWFPPIVHAMVDGVSAERKQLVQGATDILKKWAAGDPKDSAASERAGGTSAANPGDSAASAAGGPPASSCKVAVGNDLAPPQVAVVDDRKMGRLARVDIFLERVVCDNDDAHQPIDTQGTYNDAVKFVNNMDATTARKRYKKLERVDEDFDRHNALEAESMLAKIAEDPGVAFPLLKRYAEIKPIDLKIPASLEEQLSLAYKTEDDRKQILTGLYNLCYAINLLTSYKQAESWMMHQLGNADMRDAAAEAAAEAAAGAEGEAEGAAAGKTSAESLQITRGVSAGAAAGGP